MALHGLREQGGPTSRGGQAAGLSPGVQKWFPAQEGRRTRCPAVEGVSPNQAQCHVSQAGFCGDKVLW